MKLLKETLSQVNWISLTILIIVYYIPIISAAFNPMTTQLGLFIITINIGICGLYFAFTPTTHRESRRN